MSVYYIYSEATGNGDGSSWANAFISFRYARKSIRSGDIVHWHPEHKEKPIRQIFRNW